MLSAICAVVLAAQAASAAGYADGNHVFISSVGESAVVVYSLDNSSIAGRINGTWLPGIITASPDGRFVCFDDTFNISVIDTANLKLLGSVARPAGKHPFDLAVGPDKKLYLLYLDKGELLVYDAVTGSESVKIMPDPGDLPVGIEISPDGKTLYVACAYRNVTGRTNNVTGRTNISSFDTLTGKMLSKVPINVSVLQMKLSSDGSMLVLGAYSYSSSAYYLIPVATRGLVIGTPITVDSEIRSLVFSPDSRMVYLITRPIRTLDVVDLANRSIIHSVPFPHQVITMDVTGDGKTLLLACNGDGLIGVDTSSYATFEILPDVIIAHIVVPRDYSTSAAAASGPTDILLLPFAFAGSALIAVSLRRKTGK
ncbi:MAG: hypothetical protein WBZ29_08260 [Methanocella sp.]